jgi:uncharacterized membrane protein
MENTIFKKIIGVLIIAFILTLTVVLIKRLPPLLKIVNLGVDVTLIYLTIKNFFKKNGN